MLSNSTVRSAIFGAQLGYLKDQDRFFFSSFDPQYRFNIIGTGMIGMEHIRVTLLEGRAMIGGIYDPSPQSSRTAEELVNRLQPHKVTVHTTLEAACTDPDADALIICTPNHTHLKVLKVAVKSQKPILLEKPMATTIKDAYEILCISRNYSSFIQIGLQYRYKAMYRECYGEVIQNKALGELKTITIMEHRLPFIDKVEQWNKFSHLSGGTLVEKCCHYFDLFNLFATSRPTVVSAVGDMATNFKDFRYNEHSSDIIDNAFVFVGYENGIKANFNLCMFSPMFHEEITLCGEEGRIHAYETEDFMPGERIKNGFQMHCSNGRPSRKTTLHYPTVIEESGHAGSTFFEHVQFVENIKAGNSGNSATVEEGVWSVVVGGAAEEAIRRGNSNTEASSTGKNSGHGVGVVQIDEYLSAHLPSDAQI